MGEGRGEMDWTFEKRKVEWTEGDPFLWHGTAQDPCSYCNSCPQTKENLLRIPKPFCFDDIVTDSRPSSSSRPLSP